MDHIIHVKLSSQLCKSWRYWDTSVAPFILFTTIHCSMLLSLTFWIDSSLSIFSLARLNFTIYSIHSSSGVVPKLSEKDINIYTLFFTPSPAMCWLLQNWSRSRLTDKEDYPDHPMNYEDDIVSRGMRERSIATVLSSSPHWPKAFATPPKQSIGLWWIDSNSR